LVLQCSEVLKLYSNRSRQEAGLICCQLLHVSCLTFSLTQKMEAISSFETLGCVWTICCYSLDDHALHFMKSCEVAEILWTGTSILKWMQKVIIRQMTDIERKKLI
jgi:hypothetical protein